MRYRSALPEPPEINYAKTPTPDRSKEPSEDDNMRVDSRDDTDNSDPVPQESPLTGVPMNMMTAQSYDISSRPASCDEDSDGSNYRRECAILNSTEGLSCVSPRNFNRNVSNFKSVHFTDDDSDDSNLRREEKILS